MKRRDRHAKGRFYRLIRWLTVTAAGDPAGHRLTPGGAAGQLVERLEDRALLSQLVWTGAAGNEWSNPDNWAVIFGDPRAPRNGDELLFTDTSGSMTPHNDMTNLSVATIRIATLDTSFAITGNRVTLGGNGVIGAVQVARPTGGTGATHSLNIGLTEGSSSIQVSVDPNYTLNIGGALSGAGAVDKLGGGRLNLTANSPNFSGALNVDAGVVGASASQALGNTTGETFVASGTTLVVEPGASGSSEGVQIAGAGNQNQGALRATGSLTWAGGITLGSGSRIAVDGGDFTMSGAVTHEGSSFSLNKTGPGRLILSGAATGGTDTTVSAGALRLSGPNPSLGATTVSGGAALELSGGRTATVTSLSLSGSGAGSGALLNVQGNNSINGPVTLAADATIGSTAGTLTVTGNVSTGSASPGRALTVRGFGNVTIGGAAGTGAITGSGRISKTDPGTLTLSGSSANTYGGATEILQGTLVAGKVSALGAATTGTIVSSGGSLGLSGGLTFAGEALTINGAGAGGAGGALRSVSGSNTWQSDVLIGSDTASVGAAAGSTLIMGGSLDVTPARFTWTAAGPGEVLIPRTLTLAGDDAVQLANNVNLRIDQVVLNGSGRTGNGAILSINGDNTLRAPISIAGSSTIGSSSPSAGSMTLTDPINSGNGGHTLTFRTSGSRIVAAGAMTGNATLRKRGSSTLRLSAANSYSGTTQVEEGSLQVANSGALGTTGAGTVVSSGAQIAVDGVAVTGETLALSGNASPLQNLVSSREGSVWGGAITLTGGPTKIAAGGGLFTITGTVTAGNNRLIFLPTTSGSIHVGGVIASAGAVEKEGGGVLTLSGANTYAAPVSVLDGTLRVLTNTALGDNAANSPVTISSGGTLALASGPGMPSSSLSFSRPLTLGGLGAGGAGALLGVGGANTWTGPVSIASATRIGADLGSGGSGGLLVSGSISGAGALSTVGTGVVGLRGENGAYTGQINVLSGTLSVEGPMALGEWRLQESNTIVEPGATVSLAGYVIGRHSHLTMVESFRVAGKLKFDGVELFGNTHGGVTLDGKVHFTGSPEVISNVPATMNANVSGFVTSLQKGGAASLTLTAPGNTYNGTTIGNGTTFVNAGKLLVNSRIPGRVSVNAGGVLGGTGTVGSVTVNAGGVIDAGVNGPGTLTVDGNLHLASNGILRAQINGTTAGSQYDQIVVTGPSVTLGTAAAPAILDTTLGFNMTNQFGFPLFAFSPALVAHTATGAGVSTTGAFSTGSAITMTAPDGDTFDFGIDFAGGASDKDLVLHYASFKGF